MITKWLKEAVPVVAFLYLGVQPVLAQELLTALPGFLVRTQITELVIRGEATNFVAGQTAVNVGPGIQVQSVIVVNSTSLRITVKVFQNAAFGPRNVTVTTVAGSINEQVTLTNGIEILDTDGQQLLVIVNPVPVKSLLASDFDPTNLTGSPIIFTVHIFHDQTPRNLRAELSVEGFENGLLFTATKQIDDLEFEPTPFNFDNRQFDNYDATAAGQQVIDIGLLTGFLVSDIYSYNIELFDENGNLVGEETATNVIENPVSDLELISPGFPLDESPEIINTKYPYFLWFSQLSSFKLTVYPVFNGQFAAEDILINQPVFEQENLLVTNFLYPNSAEQLVEGQTYAWQVTGEYTTGSGTQNVMSEPFWFTVEAVDPNSIYVQELEVTPIQTILEPGASLQFQAIAYDETGLEVNVIPNWRLVPSDVGVITFDGLFTAGSRPATFAVVAEYGSVENYATVSIPWSFQWWNIEKSIRKIFGIPENTPPQNEEE